MNARVLTALVVVCFAGLPAARATNFALLLGPSIQGESADPAFPGGIDVLSLSLSGPISTGTSGSLRLDKHVDKATPKLLEACASGRHIRLAQLFGKTGSPPQQLFKIEFRDVLISGITQGKFELDGMVRETVELSYSSAYFTYYEQSGAATAAYLPPAGGADSDGDGVPDVVELHYRMNPAVNDASQDPDGDGLSSLTEIRLGFNPASGDSFFRAEVAPVTGNPNAVDVSWECVPGKPYVIQWSPDLVTPFTNFSNHTPEGTSATVRLNKIGLRGFFKVRPFSL